MGALVKVVQISARTNDSLAQVHRGRVGSPPPDPAWKGAPQGELPAHCGCCVHLIATFNHCAAMKAPSLFYDHVDAECRPSKPKYLCVGGELGNLQRYCTAAFVIRLADSALRALPLLAPQTITWQRPISRSRPSQPHTTAS